MRKWLLVLFLLLSVSLMYGCQQAASPQKAMDPDDCAAALGDMLFYSTKIDNTAGGLMGAFSVPEIAALSATEITREAGWFSFEWTSDQLEYSFKTRIYRSDGAEITDLNDADETNKIEIALQLTVGETMSFIFGTTGDPMTYDGIRTGAKTIDGPISMSATDGTDTFSVQLSYDGVTLDANGFPTGGSSNFSIAGTGYETVTGTATYSGTTATITIAAPASIASSYTFNMSTGHVTPASF